MKLKKEVGTKSTSEELSIAMNTIGFWDKAVRDGKLILEGFEKTAENALSLRDENRFFRGGNSFFAVRLEVKKNERLKFIQ